jgi:hypothetical protein
MRLGIRREVCRAGRRREEEKGEGRREKGEGRREKGEGRREDGEGGVEGGRIKEGEG